MKKLMKKVIEKYGDDVGLIVSPDGGINVVKYDFIQGKDFYGSPKPRLVGAFESLIDLKEEVDFNKNL